MGDFSNKRQKLEDGVGDVLFNFLFFNCFSFLGASLCTWYRRTKLRKFLCLGLSFLKKKIQVLSFKRSFLYYVALHQKFKKRNCLEKCFIIFVSGRNGIYYYHGRFEKKRFNHDEKIVSFITIFYSYGWNLEQKYILEGFWLKIKAKQIIGIPKYSV